MSYNMNSKSIWNTAMWFQSACLLFLLASANTPGEIQNVQLESLFKLCGVFLKHQLEAEIQSNVTPVQPET